VGRLIATSPVAAPQYEPLPARPAPSRAAIRDTIAAHERPGVHGKFLFVGDQKLYVRGVTYGTFRPLEDGCEFPELPVVGEDFTLMAANGINAVRTYSVPPRWLLDAALRHGLRVMVGLPMERYIGYLADRKTDAPDLTELVRAAVGDCAGHPAVLAYSIGNEIPASIARWHGTRRVERYLEGLYHTVKDVDPEGLVTYANYPSTEYLSLHFLDFLCFNVFLEEREKLEAYIARLQCLAGDRPLVMGELGLDSYRNGEDCQRHAIEWQIRASFEGGCAGTFVYSWTDEWYRGGAAVHDWEFGLTRRDRRPKPALATVQRAFAESPFVSDIQWPRVSVAVCTYNGSRTLEECLEGLERLDYPDYEVIVVNDGSTDATAEIAARYRCRLISTENRGLSNARNTALAKATGSIVAYIDDDAYPDPHWLRYFALTLLESSYAAVGGPNLAPPGDGWIADCVANAPGNPTHVLLSDRDAEHIPGCNMAFRKSVLEAVGGFDARFCVAGDDVDLCWRLTDAGFTLGFSPAAMVWHHRRNSVRAFWRQQRGYGRAEGMLERWWPGRHDDEGHVSWTGRIYGRGLVRALSWGRSRVYHGVWGAAPFQSLYEPASGGWGTLVQSPVWYLLTAALGAISILGLDWTPLRFAFLPFSVAVAALLVQAGKNTAHAVFHPASLSRWDVLRRRVVTAGLFLVQPVARLSGRLGYQFWNRHWWGEAKLRPLWPHTTATWTERWQDPAARLGAIEEALQDEGVPVRRGGDFDRWDLQVRWGSLGAARLLLGVEDHDRGHQLVRVRVWPRWPLRGPLLTLLFGGLALGAARANAFGAAVVLGGVAAFIGLRTVVDVTAALNVTGRALKRLGLAGP
jgi:glycosyltransferase involved in cell wall biosynthesis